MSYTFTRDPGSVITFTITVPPAEYQTDLEKAATRIAERTTIPGFRPGKAPFSVVRQQVGDIRLLEEALQTIVEKNFFSAVKTENLETVGMPEVTIQKIAPRNDVVFTAKVALLPGVKLPKLDSIKVERKTISVSKEEVDAVVENVRKMHAKEVAKDGASTAADKLVVTLDMFIDNVAIEGGHADNHQIYLSEPHYVPGLAEQLVGLKKGEQKEFRLAFPKDNYQKNLAGKDVDFKVKVNDVFELQYPEVNDEFAEKLGQKNLTELRDLLTKNISTENEKREDQRVEAAILEAIVEKTTFDEIPDIIITAEKQKMFYELKRDIEERGLSFDEYLANLKKTEQEIFNDFKDGAMKRAKAALISRAIAKEQNIAVEQDELDKEIELIRQSYPNNPQVEENLKRHEVIDTLAAAIQNRKVMSYLKEAILGTKKSA